MKAACKRDSNPAFAGEKCEISNTLDLSEKRRFLAILLGLNTSSCREYLSSCQAVNDSAVKQGIFNEWE